MCCNTVKMKVWVYRTATGLGSIYFFSFLHLLIGLVTNSWIDTDYYKEGFHRFCLRNYTNVSWTCYPCIYQGDNRNTTKVQSLLLGFLINAQVFAGIAGVLYQRMPVTAAFQMFSGGVASMAAVFYLFERPSEINNLHGDDYGEVTAGNMGLSFYFAAAGGIALVLNGIILMGISGSQGCSLEKVDHDSVDWKKFREKKLRNRKNNESSESPNKAHRRNGCCHMCCKKKRAGSPQIISNDKYVDNITQSQNREDKTTRVEYDTGLQNNKREHHDPMQVNNCQNCSLNPDKIFYLTPILPVSCSGSHCPAIFQQAVQGEIREETTANHYYSSMFSCQYLPANCGSYLEHINSNTNASSPVVFGLPVIPTCSQQAECLNGHRTKSQNNMLPILKVDLLPQNSDSIVERLKEEHSYSNQSACLDDNDSQHGEEEVWETKI